MGLFIMNREKNMKNQSLNQQSSKTPSSNPCYKKGGYFELITGPMFSEKTTELISKVKRHMSVNELCTVIKYSHDNRYSEEYVVSHNKKKIKANITTSGLLFSTKQWNQIAKSVCVAIDEGQFFGDELSSFVAKCLSMDKHVIVAALDLYHTGKPWKNIMNLAFTGVDNHIKKCARCTACKSEYAVFTYKLRGIDEESIDIGGSDKYTPHCRSCFMKKMTRNQYNGGVKLIEKTTTIFI